MAQRRRLRKLEMCGADCVGWSCYVPKNRYLSVDPSVNPFDVAYQVKLVEAADYPTAVGRAWWVDLPVCYDYPDGNPVPGATTCDGADRFGWVSKLTNSYMAYTWPESPLHITDCGIVPDVTYEIQAFVCPPVITSDPLVISTAHDPEGDTQSWGDLTGGPVPDVDETWYPPERATNFVDIEGAIRTFEDNPPPIGFPPRVWVDMESNQVINFGDIGFVIKAFEGVAYADLTDLPDIGRHPAECLPDGMVLIPGGEFEMGDHHDGYASSLPVHAVYVDEFLMDVYEVTNEKYCIYLNFAYSQGLVEVIDGIVHGADGGESYCFTYDGDPASRIHWDGSGFIVETGKEDFPVVGVSWHGAAAYANWRSVMEGRTPSYDLSTWACDFAANGYRLPTEAEWEYAARGGEHDPYYRYPWGDAIDGSNANYANSGDPFEDDFPGETPVGYYDGNQTPPGADMANGYGLYDVAGNDWEWCNDWYASPYSPCAPPPCDNPQGPATGSDRVLRGGASLSPNVFLRTALRFPGDPQGLFHSGGFRLVLDPE